MYEISQIQEFFHLPIYFEKQKVSITPEIINDFQFDNSNNPYQILFANKKYTGTSKNNIGTLSTQILANKWREYYSYNPEFIEKLQKYIENYKFDNSTYYREFIQLWLDLKNETCFKKKYEFFDWSHLEFLNKNETALQCINYINISSPVISLLLPFILFLIPLVVLFLKNSFSLPKYFEMVKSQFKNHAFGKIFHLFGDNISTTQKMYTSLGIAFYFFTSYQNVLLCIKTYNNFKNIQTFLFRLKSHLAHTLDLVQFNIELCEHCDLTDYNDYLSQQTKHMKMLYEQLEYIQSPKFSFLSVLNIGKNMKLFYELYSNESIHKLLMFSFGMNSFSENIEGLLEWIHREKVNKCELSNSKKHSIKNNNYIYFLNNQNNNADEKDISTKYNNANLNHNYIIHGPNASGKTTFLKATFLNILFSQQFGFGCYSSCVISPYRKLFSYINIPDTSDRDSLFQAEARRCLNIIDDVKDIENENDVVSNNEVVDVSNKSRENTYFAIFDELYSGTNPNEATLAAKAFLKYIEKLGIRFLLTSHFDSLKKSKYLTQTKNYYMNSYYEKNENGIEEGVIHTYKIKKGKTNTVGGIDVLKKIGYPDEILREIKNL